MDRQQFQKQVQYETERGSSLEDAVTKVLSEHGSELDPTTREEFIREGAIALGSN